MSLDPPPLVLEDIVHGMSPSPGPCHSTLSPDVRSPTPEQLDEEQASAMRKRALEISSTAGMSSSSELTRRETELVSMVLALSSRPNPSSVQLLRQADVIAGLKEQRDFLIREADRERERWTAEREGWDRQAEALIAQRALGSANEWNSWSGYVKDAAVQQRERECQGLIAENKSLQAKLQDARYRLATLESQLTNLRPLLLTQPTITQEAFGQTYPYLERKPQSTTIPKSPPPPPPDPEASTSTSAQPPPTSEEAQSPPASLQHVLGEPVPPSGHDMRIGVMSYVDEATPRVILPDYGQQQPTHYRRAAFAYPVTRKYPREKGKEKAKGSAKKAGKVSTIANDARAEHLLLAARRLGRQRAFVIGGLIQVEKEKAKAEREARRKAAEEAAEAEDVRVKELARKQHKKMPHALKEKGATSASDAAAKIPGPGKGFGKGPFPWAKLSTLPLKLSPLPLVDGASFGTWELPPPPKPVTPARSAPQKKPPTPLDSLLSAARAMMDPISVSASPSTSSAEEDTDADDVDLDLDAETAAEAGPSSRMVTRRMARKRPMPESPVPAKRRKAGTGTGAVASETETERAMRERARGAERVRSALDVLADQAAAFSSGNGKGKGKGKGKEREPQRSMEAGLGQFMANSRRLPQRRAKVVLEENGIWSSLKPVRWGNEEGSSGVAGGRTLLGEEDAMESDPEVGGEDARLADVFMDYANTAQTTASDEPVASASGLSRSNQTSTHSSLHPPAPEQTARPLSDPPPNSGSQHVVSRNAAVTIAVHSPSVDVLASSAHVDTHQRAPTTPISLDKCTSSSSDMTMDDLAGGGRTRVVHTAPGMSMEGLTAMPDLDMLEDIEMEQAADRDLARAGAGASTAPSSKRTRSPYVKWSQVEDDKLAQAVATFGQKWDLVQKELPNRGYHQVRQRWLRKLGVFDSKPDVSAYQTGFVNFPAGANILPAQPAAEAAHLPQPKLGLAPLSSDLSFSRR
ncbi:hypothetical protein FIBSPDRAFT_1044125 [Athelia psychrophila]|uniref:Uncharacterized protein n=1 Tax=Athelia psychrophila TaxID=1759441 RepID=A0A166K757_9AGAM|nr:hypothetical protein FIBSPDRAFT_1044125 [Fibularhizoctonia sp. CBS 109695]